MSFRVSLIGPLMLVLWSVPVAGHDLRGLGDNSLKISDLVSSERLQELAAAQADPEARSVYAQLLLWRRGSTLKACFFSGTQEERNFFVGTTAELITLSKVNLKVDFGAAPAYRYCSEPGRAADMRVSFSHGCCSGYVGRLAHYPESDVLNGPTIKVEGILADGSDRAKKTIMHEVMHSWGFEHEHQAPDAPCEFNKAVVQIKTGWSDDEYADNLERLNRNVRFYKWTSYDNDSIMKYFFPADELKDGTNSPCYSQENLVPSARDIKGLQDAYPSMPPAISRQRERALVGGIATSDAPKPIRDLARALRQLDE
jgi:hypothetical protein